MNHDMADEVDEMEPGEYQDAVDDLRVRGLIDTPDPLTETARGAIGRTANGLGLTLDDHEWGVYVYVPLTLRQVDRGGVRLNSKMGHDAAEHDAMLDEPGLLRAAIDITREDCEVAALLCSMEVRDATVADALDGTEADWHRGTPLPTEIAGDFGWGEAGLRRAGAALRGDEYNIEQLVRSVPGVGDLLNQIAALLDDECDGECDGE